MKANGLRLTVLALVALAALPAAAQSAHRLTVKGGIDSSNPDVSAHLNGLTVETGSKTAPVIGVGLESRLSDTWSTQVELMYVRRDTDMHFSGDGQPRIDAVYKLSYLDMPVTVKAAFLSAPFRPFLFAGPVFGIRLDAKSDNVAGGSGQSFSVKDQIRSTNLALTGGGGFDIRAGDSFWITLEGRYVYGLLNLSGAGDSWKTRDVQGLVGVGFNL